MNQLDPNVSINVQNQNPNPIHFNSAELDLLHTQAQALHKKGQFNESKRAFRHLLSKNTTYEYCLSFSRLLFDEQDWLECLRTLEFALNFRKSQLQGLHDLYRMQGCCFTQIGNWDRAEESFYEALKHPGPVDTVLVNLGTLDIQRKQWESATISFREAVNLNVENDKAWVGLSLCHRFKGDHALSLANLEKALDINAKNETALGLMLAWYSEDNIMVLFERLREYVLEEGSDPQLWLAFIESARKTGNAGIARLELERLRLTHPEFVPAFQYKG